MDTAERPRRAPAIVRAVLAIALLSAFDHAAAQTKPAPLSRQQIEALLDIKTPDAVVATEIRQRGVGFVLDAGAIDTLRRRGAGAATVRALSGFVRQTTLVVRTGVANAEIVINGRTTASTDITGVARIPLAPGTYDVVAKAANRQPATANVRIANRREETLDLTLAKAVGTVVLHANVAGAVVSGLGAEKVPVESEIEAATGTHRLLVSHECCAPEAVTVTVAAGERSEATVALYASTRFIDQTMREAREAIEQEQYERAAQLAAEIAQIDRRKRSPFALLNEPKPPQLGPIGLVALASAILKVAPDDVKAQASLGQALAAQGQWEEAATPIKRAIAGGDTIRMYVLHHRSGLFGAMGCPSTLDVSRQKIQLHGCLDTDSFAVPPSAVLDVQKSPNRAGAIVLSVAQIRGKPREFTLFPASQQEARAGNVNLRNRPCDSACQVLADSLLAILSEALPR